MSETPTRASLADLYSAAVSRRDALLGKIWRSRPEDVNWWQRIVLRALQILIAVGRDLVRGQISLRAMSLVFTTMIGFFPLLALSFAILKSLGVHNAMEPTLLTLLEPMGDRGEQITAQILGYVDELRVEVIGITSIGLLLYIVLDMMRKIELSFNHIWAVKVGRSWSSRVSEYLFAVIVSPILLFMSISMTGYVQTNYFSTFLASLSYGGLILNLTAWIVPILLMSLAFAFAYSFLPNTRVQFASAFVGGLVTTIIWKLMGSVFQGFFVASARDSIYLAFATPIALLFFTYFAWLVALIGSSIAYYHQNPGKTRKGREESPGSIAQQEQVALAVSAAIIRQFQNSAAPLTEEQLVQELDMNPGLIEQALVDLQSIGLITASADSPPRYLPRKTVAELSLVSIWQQIRNCHADVLDGDTESPDLERVRSFQKRLASLATEQLGKERFY
jgi:membrane protein